MKQFKKHSLFTSSLIVSFIAIFGKLIGFVREAIIAAFYGLDSSTDAFFFAQSMPSMLFPAVCNSISTAFISIYVTKIIKKDKDSNKFVTSSLIATLTIAIILSIFAIVIAPFIVPIFAPGFEGETLSLAIDLTRLTMGSFVLTMASYMLGAVLNSHKLFYGAQIAGLISNIFIVIATICLGENQSIYTLTITVIAGHFLQVLTLIFYSKNEIHITVKENPFNTEVKKMLILAIPILLGNSVVQIQNIVDKALASKLPVGVVSALSYSNSLNSIVIMVFIASIATVIYPTLITNISNNDMDSYGKHLLQGILTIVIVLLPITIITILFASDIVSIVFHRGNFDKRAVELTSTALMFYAIKYIFVGIRELLIRGFYALKDTKTPLINSSVAVAINILISLVLAPKIGIAGIAIGSSISSIISAFLLFRATKHSIYVIKFKNIVHSVIKIIISGLVSTILLVFFKQKTSLDLPIFRFIFATILCFGSYILILIILRCKEMLFVISTVKRKLRSLRK